MYKTSYLEAEAGRLLESRSSRCNIARFCPKKPKPPNQPIKQKQKTRRKEKIKAINCLW
jgi:hypothetical protein